MSACSLSWSLVHFIVDGSLPDSMLGKLNIVAEPWL